MNSGLVFLLFACIVGAIVFVVGTIGNNVINKMDDTMHNRNVKKEETSDYKSLSEIYNGNSEQLPDNDFASADSGKKSSVRYCSSCGMQLQPGMKYCPKCGRNIDS